MQMKTTVGMAEWFDSFSDVCAAPSEAQFAAENAQTLSRQEAQPGKSVMGQRSKKALQV